MVINQFTVMLLSVLVFLNSLYASTDNNVGAYDELYQYVKHRKVLIDAEHAMLCLSDIEYCVPVLLGKDTPRGQFKLSLYRTEQQGYGGEVIGFTWGIDRSLYAIHRLWLLNPSENRLQRLQSSKAEDRIITGGCINVDDKTYHLLRDYFYLEIK